MAGRKQVMDMRSETGGVSQKESDEQQRNWTAQQWKKKAADSLANYDPTRAKLNFEVVRGVWYFWPSYEIASFPAKSKVIDSLLILSTKSFNCFPVGIPQGTEKPEPRRKVTCFLSP